MAINNNNNKQLHWRAWLYRRQQLLASKDQRNTRLKPGHPALDATILQIWQIGRCSSSIPWDRKSGAITKYIYMYMYVLLRWAPFVPFMPDGNNQKWKKRPFRKIYPYAVLQVYQINFFIRWFTHHFSIRNVFFFFLSLFAPFVLAKYWRANHGPSSKKINTTSIRMEAENDTIYASSHPAAVRMELII